jgi:predicted nucleic acid-binding protein
MTTYYLDSSALIKRYIDELGSDWLRATLGAQPLPAIVIVHLVIVEVTSALTRRMREGTLTSANYARVQDAFRSDCLHEYEIITAVGDIIDQANLLLERYPLRAYDAVHLATAVVANQQLLANNLSPLIFLSADDRLNDAAYAEGLMVDNPNHHP